MGARDVARLLEDPGIVRHRGKIEAALANARAARGSATSSARSRRSCGASSPAGGPERPRRMTRAALVQLTETPASRALSKELRARGFRFVGPTTCTRSCRRWAS